MSMTEQFNVQPAPQRKVLGIEFGSTRIKAVLTDGHGAVLATGSHTWENQLVNGIWTYPLEQVWNGLQACYRDMADRYRMRYGSPITVLDAIGFSGMMHGYLAFDRDGNQLVPFRTWRNTITNRAADLLTKQFSFNIPQRWSIAHLYQAILNEEAHVSSIDYLTTLAGYVHWQLTGERVLGVGEASGLFPIDSAAMTYDADMVDRFDRLVAGHHFRWKLLDILPRVLPAGVQAGRLTPEGAQLLDPTGELQPGTPFCPPEGDAGTGMVATNSVAERTGNVSAGTSIFAMVVLERPLSQVYPEIDMVTTPDGKPVAMVHCNNCTSEINAWAGMLQEFAHCIGSDLSDDRLYSLLYSKAAEGEKDGGGLLCCNYLSGEPVVDMEEGRPLLVRRPESRLTLGNFMRAQLYSAVATLKIGMELLTEGESVKLDRLMGHGGLFKTPEAGQKIMAAAIGVPVSVMENAGEGGAWGIALLAEYMLSGEGMTLAQYMEQNVFTDMPIIEKDPAPADIAGFTAYMHAYQGLLAVEETAIQAV